MLTPLYLRNNQEDTVYVVAPLGGPFQRRTTLQLEERGAIRILQVISTDYLIGLGSTEKTNCKHTYHIQAIIYILAFLGAALVQGPAIEAEGCTCKGKH
jgi:hypothetical protein